MMTSKMSHYYSCWWAERVLIWGMASGSKWKKLTLEGKTITFVEGCAMFIDCIFRLCSSTDSPEKKQLISLGRKTKPLKGVQIQTPPPQKNSSINVTIPHTFSANNGGGGNRKPWNIPLFFFNNPQICETDYPQNIYPPNTPGVKPPWDTKHGQNELYGRATLLAVARDDKRGLASLKLWTVATLLVQEDTRWFDDTVSGNMTCPTTTTKKVSSFYFGDAKTRSSSLQWIPLQL